MERLRRTKPPQAGRGGARSPDGSVGRAKEGDDDGVTGGGVPDPARAFRELGAGDDAFTRWWAQQIQDVHGVDMRQPPPGPLPELLFEFRAG
jgi:hypothetical protein